MNTINIEDTILYEDKYILVCQKPAGFPVQSKRLGTLDMECALRNYLAKKGQEPYVAVIHRLDQPVQGVLVFAKDRESGAKLSKQMQQGKFEKIYLAYTQGHTDKKQETLVDELEKDGRTNTSKVVSKKTQNSKRAELSYKVLKETEEGSLLKVSLKTGRHHQIRVQLAHAGLPIFGDAKYNVKCTKEDASQGISLCAYKLSFLHPVQGKKMEFQVMPVGNFPIV